MSSFAHARAGPAVRLAAARDTKALLRFLDRDPNRNAFLEHLVRRDGLARNAFFRCWYVALRDGEVCGACMASGNIVPAVAEAPVARSLAEALDSVRPGTQSLVGERATVNAMWEHLRRHAPAVRLMREEQPFYVMERPLPREGALATPDSDGLVLRLARGHDLDLLVDASADMLREEILDDPFARDPVGFRAQIWRMIRERSVYVAEADGRVVFKAHVNVRTPRAVQVSGVYTLPAWRGRGHARRGMAALARRLLADHESVCLYVNGENVPAIRVYEQAGFRRTGAFKSIFFRWPQSFSD